MTRILTGLQATGSLHIGNYLGAILPMVQKAASLQPEDQMFMFVPDLHTLTIDIDYQQVYANILQNLQVYIAAGIPTNQPNVYLYRQSRIPAHSELAWILSCFTYFGEMSRMTQFKDKSTQHDQNVNVGLFAYPILMAGDILLYGADYVPVGEDQLQHLELARDIAIRMNNKFIQSYPQGLFVVPKPGKEQLAFMQVDQALRIRSLTNPEKKMSKSDPSLKSKILLTDDPQQAAKKIMSATTDSLGVIHWDWQNQPGITNLLQLFSLLTGHTQAQTKQIWIGTQGYGDLKKAVATATSDFLQDLQIQLAQVRPQQIEQVLKHGEQRASTIAGTTMQRVQQALGLRLK